MEKRGGLKVKIAGIILLILVLPFLAHVLFLPIEFNQFQIQSTELRYATISGRMMEDLLVSAYSSGLNMLFQKHPPKPQVEDTQAFFAYVFSYLPSRIIVYPTEGFYYYHVKLKDAAVSGNLRVADLNKGILHLAYFTLPLNTSIFYLDITKKDGLTIEKESNFSYALTYNNKRVHVTIPKTAFIAPKKLRLLPEEEFVGQIHDESGIKFFLIYNNKTYSFYNVVNEEEVTERFESLPGDHLRGKRTDFLYYHDIAYARKILAGVYIKNVEANNFYDGPGDQVPYQLNLRSKLTAVYPQTLRGAGTDDQGVYLNTSEWMRIAISPYLRYSFYDDVITKTRNCLPQQQDKNLFWTCITQEEWNTPAWRLHMKEELRKEGKIWNDPREP